MKSILFLVGSLRAESMNRRLSLVAERMLPDGDASTRVDLADIPFLNQDLRGERTPASVVALRAAIQAANGVSWTAPEYNFALPGIVKNAIDWCSRPMLPRNNIVGKPMNAVVATESTNHGARALADLKRIWGNCGGVSVGSDFVPQEAPGKFVVDGDVESLEQFARAGIQLNVDNLVRTIQADVGAVALANWDTYVASMSS